MSKMSTPCIFPRISKRSRPVAWSRSLGTSPGRPPGGMRSCAPVISVIRAKSLSRQPLNLLRHVHGKQCRTHGQRAPSSGLIVRLWGPPCLHRISHQPPLFVLYIVFFHARRQISGRALGRGVHCRAETAKLRKAIGRATVRLASTGAARRRNMANVLSGEYKS